MKILLIEPYYTGSHKQWVDGYKKYSKNDIKVLSMKGQFWKWRMHGGAITLAKEFHKMDWLPDLIFSTDMIDITTFLSLTRKKLFNIPTVIYFHENQLSYPWSPNDRDIINKRDSHYGFINFSSALSADKIFFNSNYHMQSFIRSLEPFLKQFPDNRESDSIEMIKNKSSVLYLGIDLKRFDSYKTNNQQTPIILWNHRWEYDKNPELFFALLKELKNNNYDFNLAVLGENFSQSPMIFKKAKNIFKDNITHWGYIKSFDEYSKWLWKADILPVTSNQEFFGASVMEAIYCNTWPILPNRLTYPELIPNELHHEILYNTEEELFRKTSWAIKKTKKLSKTSLVSVSEQFDWQIMAPIYDEKLEAI